MNNVNIAEILRDAPKGLELRMYSPMIGRCTLKRIDCDVLWVVDDNGHNFSFYRNGNYIKDRGECLIFPDERKTWDNWQESIFMEGCFVKDTVTGETFLYKGHCCLQDSGGLFRNMVCLGDFRFANGREISSFLNRLLDNGFKYNARLNTIQPRGMKPNSCKTGTVRLRVDRTRYLFCEYSLKKDVYDTVKKLLDELTDKK